MARVCDLSSEVRLLISPLMRPGWTRATMQLDAAASLFAGEIAEQPDNNKPITKSASPTKFRESFIRIVLVVKQVICVLRLMYKKGSNRIRYR